MVGVNYLHSISVIHVAKLPFIRFACFTFIPIINLAIHCFDFLCIYKTTEQIYCMGIHFFLSFKDIFLCKYSDLLIVFLPNSIMRLIYTKL